jgi:hypothetical protein
MVPITHPYDAPLMESLANLRVILESRPPIGGRYGVLCCSVFWQLRLGLDDGRFDGNVFVLYVDNSKDCNRRTDFLRSAEKIELDTYQNPDLYRRSAQTRFPHRD